jgi:hypothetical protein
VNFGTNAKAQVVFSNTSTLIVQHLQGSIVDNYVRGTESLSNCAITSINYQISNIPSDVLSYYSPVYYYDLENEKNEGNKIVNLLKTDFMPDFIKSVKTLLSE